MQTSLCNNLDELAAILGIPTKKLTYILYTINDSVKYTKFTIPKKSGGVREIMKPDSRIKLLQSRFSVFLLSQYQQRPCSHGFEKDRNIGTNSEKHIKKRVVLNFDIQDFFGSVNFGRVFGLLKSKPFFFSKEAAAAAAKLVTHENMLPQGAPSSPIISNMIAMRMDAKLMKLCQYNSSTYTRYVDDITISTTLPTLSKKLGIIDEDKSFHLGNSIKRILKEEGFEENRLKTRIQTRHVRQEVTGITVNEFKNVKREYINNILAMIHSWKTLGPEKAAEKYEAKYKSNKTKITGKLLFRSVLIGRITYVASVRGWDDIIVHKLCRKYCQWDKNPPPKIKEIGYMPSQYDAFIGHASEQKEDIAIPLHDELKNLGLNVFIDKVEIKLGDSLTKIINSALAKSPYFIAIISGESIEKSWPDKEMNAAIAREIEGKQKIIPVFVGSKQKIEELKDHYSLINDKLYAEWDGDIAKLAKSIYDAITRV